tara:strand:+ start:568 stop:921 length:354 start_codon:yes stop_codon:yes gene_type:complete
MKITILKKESIKNKRILLLHLRLWKDDKSKYKSLGLYEYKSPRTALERKHNANVEAECQKAIYKAEIKALEDPEDDCPSLFEWIDEKVPERLNNPLKRLLIFLDKELKNKSVKEFAV